MSAVDVATIGADLSLRNDFGSGQWNGAPICIPYNVIGPATPGVNVTFDYTGESDVVGYPILATPLIEGGRQWLGRSTCADG